MSPDAPVGSSEVMAASVSDHNSNEKGVLLVSVRDEHAGTNCESGGVAILSGYDDNKNGILDSSEVDATRYVCSGIPGAPGAPGAPGSDGISTLVAVHAEPLGAACAAGGQSISWGPDANQNDVLDSSEITGTTFVCNGVAGAAPPPPLVTLTTEPAGIHCAAAGERIDVGVDADRDGLLQPSEIATTGYVCNGVSATSLTLTKITPIPTGDAACPYGGSNVQAGIDASGDAALQSNEVLFDLVLCTLRAATEIAPGSTCANGGTHYDYGLDLNQDGVLETAEIQTQEDVCASPPACGQLSQACCTTAPACADSFAECNQGTCQACGGHADVCCTTRQSCLGPTDVCSNGTCKTCGVPGGPCCPFPLCSGIGAPNPSCMNGYRCVGSEGTCVQCGLRGLPCCDSFAFACGGARCTDGSSCFNGATCQ